MPTKEQIEQLAKAHNQKVEAKKLKEMRQREDL